MKKILPFVFVLVATGFLFDFYLTVIRLPQETTLYSLYTSTLPEIDGKVDEIWNQASTLKINLEKPDIARSQNALTPNVEIRSLHNQEYVMFLVQWQDNEASLQLQPWQQKQNQWQQIKTSNYDENVYAEDRLAFLWAIKGSIFANNGCASTCHTIAAGKSYGAKYAPGKELLDMWVWGSVSTNPLGVMDDMFLDSQQASPNNFKAGVKYDSFYNPKQKNKVPQKILPKEWLAIKGRAENKTEKGKPAYFAQNKTGMLSVSKQDPEIFLMQNQEQLGSLIYKKDFHSDIKARAKFQNNQWTVEIKRKRITNDAADLQMRPQSHNYIFSLAVFDNTLLRHSYSNKVYRLAFDKKEK